MTSGTSLSNRLSVSAISPATALYTHSDAFVSGYLVGASIANVTLELSPLSGTISGGSQIATVVAGSLGQGVDVSADIPMVAVGTFHPEAQFEINGTASGFTGVPSYTINAGSIVELVGQTFGSAGFSAQVGEVGSVYFALRSPPTAAATLGVTFDGINVADPVNIPIGEQSGTASVTFSQAGQGNLGVFHSAPASGTVASYLYYYTFARISISNATLSQTTITLEADSAELINLDGVDIRPGYFSGVQVK